ncbi:unnamed protein product [Caenorhabditis brenneri]
MNSYIIYTLIVFLPQFLDTRKPESESEKALRDLRCREFYVKIFNTATGSIEYSCQNYIAWGVEREIFCVEGKEMPYIIVYSAVNASIAITFYKICCQTKECLDRYPFNPLTRFGKNIPLEHGNRIATDADYLDLVVRYLVVSVFFVGVSYTVVHICCVRRRVASQWDDEQNELDPELIAMAETPRMHIVKIGHRDDEGIPITGQHSFIDYCRLLAAYAFRDQNVKESNLIDPRLVATRILRHDLRLIREDRQPDVQFWNYMNNRVNPDERFVKILGKWVYISNRMDRDGFVDRQLPILERMAIQRYTDELKMNLKLRTKSRWEPKYTHLFDKWDIAHLMTLGSYKTDMHMIFFNSVGLGHELFQVTRPMGHVDHHNIFQAMFFHGPYFYPWDPSELIALFGEAREAFLEDPISLNLSLPIVIIGEIRGRYADLHRWLQITGLPYRRKLLFLGGYMERGSSNFEEYGIECLSFIAALKLAYPRHVFMLRGSAETTFSFAPRFCNAHMDVAVLAAARQMCNVLPLTALIEDDYLAVSSGIAPYMIEDLYGIAHLPRPIKPENVPTSVRWILFGQPNSMRGHFEHDRDAHTYRFGLRAVENLCRKYELKAVIRSRSELPLNPLIFNDGKFVTISSTPTENSGGVAMLIDENLGWIFFKLRYQTEELKLTPNHDEKMFNLREAESLKPKKKEKRKHDIYFD